VVERFVRLHLPRCRCPKPAATTARNCRTALHRLLEFCYASRKSLKWEARWFTHNQEGVARSPLRA
jgi:hypothetical protein